MELDLGDLLAISALALLAPLIVDLIPGIGLPIVVVELAMGILIGSQGLNLVHENNVVSLFSEFGLALLFFLAGFEIEFKAVKGPPLKLAAWGFLLSFGIAIAIGLTLYSVGYIRSGLLVATTLCATALGTLTPILRDSGLIRTRLGAYVVGAGVAGEFGVTVLMSLLFGSEGGLTAALLLLAFTVVTVAAGFVATRAKTPRYIELTRRSLETSSQLPIRLALATLLGLMLLTQDFGIDVILGAFAAGVVFRLAVHRDQSAVVTSKLDAIGYGFFIPVFFITSGMNFDLSALFGSVGSALRLPVFYALLLVVRGVPALVLYRNDLGATARRILALFSATSLPLIIALTQVGLQNGTMRADTAAALVAAGVLSVLINPLVALRLAKRLPAAERDAVPSPDAAAAGRDAATEPA